MIWGAYSYLLNLGRPLVVVDLETTGLSPFSERIIEIAAVKIVPTETRHTAINHLIKIDRPLPRRIQRLTGITDSMLDADGVAEKDALFSLATLINDMPIVAFNASFDIGFLNEAFRRHGLPVTKAGHSCALRLARSAWPGLPSYKLAALAQLHGLALTEAHRALADALRCAHVYYRAAGISTHRS